MNTRKLRAYQEQAFWAPEKWRRFFLLWLRQGGKTTTLGEQTTREMMKHKGRLITYASANLNMGSEMVEKEAKTWLELLEHLKAMAVEGKTRMEAGVRDSESNRAEFKAVDFGAWEDLADVMERNRLELRLWHSKTVCSRTKIIAASVRTARSWSGSVKLDEAPFVPDLRNLLAELEPIFSTDPTFKFLMAGTLPPDFAHYAYELGMEENGRTEWPVNPNGNWFKNRVGLWVHRVSIDDAAAAGRKCFDPDTGAEQTLEENRASSLDREGWDRSNRHKRPEVGTSAVSPVILDACQQRGAEHGIAVEGGELPAGWLDRVGKNKLAIGIDLATTEGKKSNPAALGIGELVGGDVLMRGITWWKTADPKVTTRNVLAVCLALKGAGRRVSVVNIDATNERFYSKILAGELAAIGINCNLIVGSDGAEYRGQKMTMKAYQGNLLVNLAEDGRLYLPQSRYVADDFMRVAKKAGSFDAIVGTNGEHGDTFDCTKHVIHGLIGSGPAKADAVEMGGLGSPPPSDRDAGRFSSENRETFTLNS